MLRELASSPSLLEIHRQLPDRWPFLLASSASAGQLGRWSMLLRSDPDQAALLAFDGRSNFLDQLQSRLKCEQHSAQSETLPFCGGWFVYLSYELAAEIEPGLKLPPARDGLPVALAKRCRSVVLEDHLSRQRWLVAENEAEMDVACAEIEAALNTAPVDTAVPHGLDVQSGSADDFKLKVDRIREYIRAGDVFQVNLSRGWEAKSSAPIDPVDLYAALARSNPAPFAALARLPGATVVSSSPERLVDVRAGQVQTRPIAGTRPRGKSRQADRLLEREMMANQKERAEHIMLIDLERNDLGRVCQIGSVEVDELMIVESYAHVHHIVSNVRGKLRPDKDAIDVIRAVFPGGTITGCPKLRCMEIIAELEGHGRGCYTGALGYLGLDGRMDLNILIRSMTVSDQHIQFRTGAGIVADSDPAAELAETQAKARGLLAAIGHA